MTYTLEQTKTLQKFFDRAVTFPPHRLAGHCANATIWAAEIRRCLDLLNGHEQRYCAMKAATADYLRQFPAESPEIPSEMWLNPEFDHRAWEPDTRTTRGVTKSQIADSKKMLEHSAKRFFARCFQTGVLSQEQVVEINRIVGFELVEVPG